MDYKLPLSLNTGTVLVPCICILIYIISWISRTSKSKLSRFPTVGGDTQSYLGNDMIDAISKYPDTPYLISDLPNKPKTLVLPMRYLDEIKSLPEHKASFDDSIYNIMSGKYSTLGTKNPVMVQSVKVDLTHNLARTLEAMQEEVDFAISDCFGDFHDWTPIQLYAKIVRVIALVSGRVFVGLPLSRNEEWIEATTNYTSAVFATGLAVGDLHPLTRDLFAPSLPEVKRVRQYKSRGGELLAPVLKERRERMKDPGFEAPADMIQFVIDNSSENMADDALFQSSQQLMVSLAAIHTTGMNVTQVLYDLALYPEHLAPLREELEEVLAANNGILLKTSLTKLRKMDSFIKESQRMSPPNIVSLMRRATSDISLKDGLEIPKGQYFVFSSIGVYRNPAIYPDPNTFKPWRFSDLRDQPENTNKYQLVTTGKESLAFGHGIHACPGRFFASNEIKLILAALITRYDIKLKEGQGRPGNIFLTTQIIPDPSAEILFRNRVV